VNHGRSAQLTVQTKGSTLGGPNTGSMKLLNSRAVSVVGRSRGLTEYLSLAEPVAVDGNNSVLSRRNRGYLVRQLAAQQNSDFPGNERDRHTHRLPGNADSGQPLADWECRIRNPMAPRSIAASRIWSQGGYAAVSGMIGRGLLDALKAEAEDARPWDSLLSCRFPIVQRTEAAAPLALCGPAMRGGAPGAARFAAVDERGG
jgi:hypothetical protein